MVARPEVAGIKLARIRIVVVLPAPFGPRNPMISPLPTSKFKSLIAVWPAYRLVRFSTLIIAKLRQSNGRLRCQIFLIFNGPPRPPSQHADRRPRPARCRPQKQRWCRYWRGRADFP